MTLVSFLLRTHLFVLFSAVIILVQGTALTKTTDVADQITELEARLETMYSSHNNLDEEVKDLSKMVELAEKRLSQLYNLGDEVWDLPRESPLIGPIDLDVFAVAGKKTAGKKVGKKMGKKMDKKMDKKTGKKSVKMSA